MEKLKNDCFIHFLQKKKQKQKEGKKEFFGKKYIRWIKDGWDSVIRQKQNKKNENWKKSKKLDWD